MPNSLTNTGKKRYEPQNVVYYCVKESHDIHEFLAVKDVECSEKRFFEDRVPTTERSGFRMLKIFLNSGDTLHVWSLEHFGLRAPEMYEFLQYLKSLGVSLVCLSQEGDLDHFIAQIERDYANPNPMAGNDGVALQHLYEIEIQANALASAVSEVDANTAKGADVLRSMVGDLRHHLSFIKQQIRHGHHEAAVGRIDNIAADF